MIELDFLGVLRGKQSNLLTISCAKTSHSIWEIRSAIYKIFTILKKKWDSKQYLITSENLVYGSTC